ncbi:MAG: DUF3466 family protein [Janthinobacterium lividum]
MKRSLPFVFLSLLTTFVAFTAVLFLSDLAHAEPGYSIADLGPGAGADWAFYGSGAVAINDRGQVVGGQGHAFLWSEGKSVDLGALPPEGPLDDTDSVANGINAHGVIVGTSGSFRPVFMSGLVVARGFITEKNRLHQLTPHNSSFIPYAINDKDEIVGLDAYRGFFYAQGKLVPLGTLSTVPTGNRSTAWSINDQGQVVGWSIVDSRLKTTQSSLFTHAFLWKRGAHSGKMRDLGTLPGWVNSYAYGINRRGEVIGSVSDESGNTDGVRSDSHAEGFLWRKGKMTALGTLPGRRNSEAFGINDSSQIVGRSDAHAFLWNSGKMLDLNSTLSSASGWILEEARAINNHGQIIGNGTLNGQPHKFLLTPR